MNLHAYRERRLLLLEQEDKFRQLCTKCFQPEFGCYCAYVRRFDPKIQFVILIHPIEVKRRIATGRMSHLCLENSRLIAGQDYSDNRDVNEILADSSVHPVVLYPGPSSVDLTSMSGSERARLFPTEKKLAVFVIDGTWTTARKMVRSANLISLPRICFSPRSPSRFRVRKQPKANCYSTIEAIHETIELLGEGRGFDVAEGEHHALLDVFDVMVERQLHCLRTLGANRHAFRRCAG